MATTFLPDEPLFEELEGPVQNIMAYLLNTYAPGAVNLRVVGNPDWGINPYKQERMPVWEALERFAQMIGWDLRWRWLPNSRTTGQLTFYEPPSDESAEVYILGPNDYYVVSTMNESMDDVRNRVYVYFGPEGSRQYVVTDDNPSIARFRFPRTMWIEEASSSPIQTSQEAQRLADAALRDLSYPRRKVVIKAPYLPLLELGDYVTLTANGEQLLGSVTYSVNSMRHEFADGRATSEIGLEAGPASLGRGKWKGGEIRRGVKYF